MNDIQRWYDKSSKLGELMTVMNSLSEKETDKLAQYLYHIVKIYRNQIKDNEGLQSIGAEKLFGYYKAYNKRRWYDKKHSLGSALNIMSTLSLQELDDLVDGFLYALGQEGLYNIYSEKKKELKEKENP